METILQHEFASRPATRADLDWVHAKLMQAIDTSPYYNDIFKAWEKQRMSRAFLGDLYQLDPWYVIVLEADGERAGFQISGPDCGALFLYWSYILAAYRQSGLAVYGMRQYLAHFDNGDWHKISTLSRTSNRAAIVIMRRFGWIEVARLGNHIFGEDYLQFEYPLTKTRPGYKLLRSGRRARLAAIVRRALLRR